MHYKEKDFGNGLKVRYRVFDYSTPEGRKEWADAVCGSVTDETFVAPADLPLAVEEGYETAAIDALRKFQEQMRGEGGRSGLSDYESVADWITESRRREDSA
ncbi:MAG: hypothetical protein IJT58_01090 [Synergistaceae bacterium]|nr:hypothetical protein [Synergistaceae bacterium]